MAVEFQLTVLLVPYVVSAAVTLGLSVVALRRIRREGWDPVIVAFLGIVFGSSLWTIARTLEFLFRGELLTQLWFPLLYVGLSLATLSGLFFALAFTGRHRYLTRRTVAIVFAPAVVAVGIAATNPVLNLFWTGEFVHHTGWYGDVLVYERDFTVLDDIYAAYTIVAGGTGLYLLFSDVLSSPDVYRRQTAAFVVGGGTALLMGLLFFLNLQPFVPRSVDLTPVGFAVMGACFGYAIFRHRLLDLVPVARNSVIANMRDGYLFLDGDDRIVDCNDAARELLDADDPIGSSIVGAGPECADLVAAHDHGTVRQEEIELAVDGEQHFLVASVSSVTRNEHLIGRLLFLRDVTERHAVQRRFQALIENSSDVIFVVDPDGEISYASPSVRTVAGADPEDVVGQNAFDFVHEEDRPAFEAAVDQLVAESGDGLRYEYRTMDGAGGWLEMEARVRNLLDSPHVGGLVVNAREITERKEREREIEAANDRLERTNEQLDQFASVISHDLRNPINVADLHLEMAQQRGREESFDKIEESLERMEGIIDDVLTLAQEGEAIGERAPVSLRELAESAWGHVQTDGLELVVADDATFEADANRLTQLFENLFRNAGEHAGDDVTVRVGLDDRTLYVADDGRGIPENRREDIVEYGHSTSDDGTGLGLAIVSQIAAGHGWDLEVTESRQGGARFEFHGVDRTVTASA